MKSNRRITVRASVAICAVGLLTTPVGATAENDFQLFMEPIVLEVLNTDQDGNSSKFQEYRDVSSGFRIPTMIIEGYGKTTDRHLSILGENIWREDARMNLNYGVWGKYAIDLDYNKIPHRFGNKGTLLWNRTSPGTLEIADSTQEQLQSDIEAAPSRNFDLIEDLLQPYLDSSDFIDLALQRDRFAGRVDFRQLKPFSWGVEYKHENRTGNRAYGGTYGFNNVQELPEPIDYNTTDASIMGEWKGKKSGVEFGYRYSEFENKTDTLMWDNPFRAFDSTNGIAYLAPTTTTEGPTAGIIDLVPNNEANLLFVSGRSQFTDNMWASGKITSSRLEQNDRLDAYTINTAIEGVDYQNGALFDPTDPSTLPRQSADLKTDLLSFDIDFGADFGEDWELKLSYDFYDYDASVPRSEFDGYVRTQAVWEEVPRVTIPYDYKKQNLGARLTWDVSKAGRLTGSVNSKKWDRQNRETNTTDEFLFGFTYDHRFNQKWNLRASWENGDRDYDSYDPEAQLANFLEPHGIDNQPGLRKYLQANRKYDDYKVDVFFNPSDALQLMFGLQGIDTDYPGGEFGLLSEELMTYNFEISYSAGENVNCYAFANIGDGTGYQTARQSGATLSTDPLNDWSATLDMDNQLYGGGVNTRFAERWSADLVLQWSEADGNAVFTTPPGGTPATAQDIPNYDDNELYFIQVKLDYELNDRSRIGVWYWYEDYTLDSFLVDNLSSYQAGLIALNADFFSYTANVVGAYLSMDF